MNQGEPQNIYIVTECAADIGVCLLQISRLEGVTLVGTG